MLPDSRESGYKILVGHATSQQRLGGFLEHPVHVVAVLQGIPLDDDQ
jgi:hypothetical protein